MKAARFSDSVLVITGDYLDEHMTVFSTGEGLIVVDTLATLPATRAALPLLRDFSQEPVRFVVNTHLDADHVSGNCLFAGSAVIAHTNGTRHLNERIYDDAASEKSIRDLIAAIEAGETPSDPTLRARRQTYIDIYTRLLEGFGDFLPAPPTVFTSGGTEILLGDTSLELHHFGPGHTDADLVIFAPGAEVLVTGDLVLGEGIIPVVHAAHGGSILGMLRALSELEKMASETTRIVPGHGSVASRELLGGQRAYLEALLARVHEAQARGLTLEQARPALELESFHRCLLYDFMHNDHVELAWRELAQGESPV